MHDLSAEQIRRKYGVQNIPKPEYSPKDYDLRVMDGGPRIHVESLLTAEQIAEIRRIYSKRGLNALYGRGRLPHFITPPAEMPAIPPEQRAEIQASLREQWLKDCKWWKPTPRRYWEAANDQDRPTIIPLRLDWKAERRRESNRRDDRLLLGILVAAGALLLWATAASPSDNPFPTQPAAPILRFEDRSDDGTVGLLHYYNGHRQNPDDDHPEDRVQVMSIETPRGTMTVRITHTVNRRCYPVRCPDTIEVLGVPDGTIALPGDMTIPEETFGEIRLLNYLGF